MAKKLSADQITLDELLKQQKVRFGDELKDSTFFELFTAEQILKDYELSYEELQMCNAGDGGDGGVDTVCVFLNGLLLKPDAEMPTLGKNPKIELFLIQSKRSPKFSEVVMKNFRDVFEDLFDFSASRQAIQGVYNSTITAFADLFIDVYKKAISSRADVSIHYIYASEGADVDHKVRKKEDKLTSITKKIYSDADVSVRYFGAKEIIAKYREVRSTTKELKKVGLLDANDGSYIALCTLPDYADFISSDDAIIRSLFESNVRDYQGNVTVNKDIATTLAGGSPEDFWFLNNGVTILTPKATSSGNVVVIDDPQIVNGLQTSYEIHAHFEGVENSRDERRVLVRVLQEEDEDARDRIIRATNRQTYMPPSATKVSDNVHRNIEQYFKSYDVYYDRKKNEHKNNGIPSSKIISVQLLGQLVMSTILERPNTARARPGDLLNKDDEYALVFDENRSPSVYLKILNLYRLVEAEILTRYKGSDKRRKFLNLRFHALYLLYWRLIREAEIGDPDDIVVKEVKSRMVERCVIDAHKAYLAAGGDDTAAKGTGYLSAIKEMV